MKMSRLQRRLQAEITLLMTSNPTKTDKLARMQAELARLELSQRPPSGNKQELAQAHK